jgi:hypothetical protein
MNNSFITNNRIENGPDTGIYGYYWNKLTIANNEIVNTIEGIHVLCHNDASRDLLMEQNYFSGIRRMGIEYQGGGFNTVVQDNYYENPRMSNVFSENNDVFAYSLIADTSAGTIARRNVVLAPQRPDGVGVRIHFEIGGDNALVEDNWVSGGNHFLAANDFVGSTSVLARNNFYTNVLQGPVGRGLTAINNGPHVTVTWNTNRGRPGRNHRFGQPINPVPPNPNPTVPGSDITYKLDGKYKQFQSDVGIDDEVGNSGSVAFQVFLDGAKVYDSGTMNGSAATKSVNLDVTGKQTLRLVVSHVGDGTSYDHADWANARLTPNGPNPTPTPTPAPSGSTWLSDLNFTSAVNGWGVLEKNKSNGENGPNDGRTMAIRDRTYSSGLGVHANSDIRVNINSQYSTFTSDVGIDNETGGKGTVVFQVFLDGRLAYDSGVVRGSDGAKQVSVDVRGAKELRLVVHPAGDGNAYDHADWAAAKLTA